MKRSLLLLAVLVGGMAHAAQKKSLGYWKVDASIAGGSPALSTAPSHVTSWTELSSSSLSLTNNTGASTIPAMIPCVTTTDSSGANCGGVDEEVGVAFVLPMPGDVEACVTTNHYMHIGNGLVITTFQIVDTDNDDSSVINLYGNAMALHQPMSSTASMRPIYLCGQFTYASAGKKTLRLKYKQASNVTMTDNYLYTVSASNVESVIHWTVRPL